MSARSILIPDSGPLFSLSAGNLLDLLLNFRVAITDVVKEETIGRGDMPGCSVEARRIHEFYSLNADSIEIRQTQVGQLVSQLRLADPAAKLPRNAGEISIQSLLIELRVTNQPAVVLFEDSWFLRNAASMPGTCGLLSTEAFLAQAQKLGLIPSADRARQAIEQLRPEAYRDSKAMLNLGGIGQSWLENRAQTQAREAPPGPVRKPE